MKVAVQCESALLQRSLELFLDDHLSSLKQCDVVIRDKMVMDSHHSLYISSAVDSDIIKPFSRSQLYLALEKFYTKIVEIQSVQAYDEEELLLEKEKDFSLLEERIDQLTNAYKNDLLKIVKAFYE